jgi:hypothetical protein
LDAIVLIFERYRVSQGLDAARVAGFSGGGLLEHRAYPDAQRCVSSAQSRSVVLQPLLPNMAVDHRLLVARA